ncbi:hypothetical protein QEG73_04045 [Chitinophagaceae bacterium 26-R-25]|nr:hypothetical protein [Chitinophagaceae bacterium 26-R-25]
MAFMVVNHLFQVYDVRSTVYDIHAGARFQSRSYIIVRTSHIIAFTISLYIITYADVFFAKYCKLIVFSITNDLTIENKPILKFQNI